MATTSEAAIANLAILHCGSKTQIDSLDDRAIEARVCKAFYAKTRDAMLRAHHWSFARAEQALAELSNTTRVGWPYVYSLPTDCLKARRLWNGEHVSNAVDEQPLEVQSGHILCCNLSPATLIYTKALTDPDEFDPCFVEALGWRLAIQILPSMTGADLTSMQTLLLGYQQAISDAKRTSIDEQKIAPKPPMSPWLAKRR